MGARADRSRFEGGERRRLTALFSDLVDSTEIASRLDPEQWQELVAHYQREAAAAIERFGGHVGKFLGDGVDAYFGYPSALEDAAERGIRAGLAIVRCMDAINGSYAKPLGVTLAVRVGLHAGSVVIAPGGDLALDVFGSVPNIASRLQAIAEPNTVVMTAAVHDAVTGMFVVDDIGEHTLKGVAAPVRLFRATHIGLQRRLALARSLRKLSKFVGRHTELRTLLDLSGLARAGAGQTALIVGEPGIGKTRLLEEMRLGLGETPHAWIECAGKPLFASAPFHAVKEMLEQVIGARPGDAPLERAQRLARALETSGLNAGEALPLFAELLDLPPEDASLSFSAEEKRKTVLEMLVDWVLHAARAQLLVVAVEDLQWVDPSTAEFLTRLSARAGGVQLLMVCTARPELGGPLLTAHTRIDLSRLNKNETQQIVQNVVGAQPLSLDLIEGVIARADGVPLFAEELARFVSSGATEGGGHDIPATLQDSLTARLDRLGAAKEIAQLGAAIGREFSYDLIRAVAGMPEAELKPALVKLGEAGLIESAGGGASYRFAHTLMQDAAYEGLLKRQRRQLHRRLAHVIRDEFPELAEKSPALLAHHWAEAGDAAQAIEAWDRAAKTATARYAYREAADALERAIDQCGALASPSERDVRALEFWRRLVGASQIAFGYSAAKTANAARMARQLAEKTGDLRKQFAYLAGEWMTASSAGNYRAAKALAEQLAALAQARGTSDAAATACMATITSCCRIGDLAGAEAAFIAGEPHFADASFCKRPGAAAQAYGNAAVTAWLMGDSRAAEQRIARVCALARTSDNPYEQAFSHHMAGMVALMLGDARSAEASASQSIVLSEQAAFPQFAAQSSIVLGRACAEQGRANEGLQLMLEGLQRMQAMRSRAGMSLYLTWLADTQRSCGDASGALESLEHALSVNPEELYLRPEALRLRGEMRLLAGDVAQARVDLDEAFSLARSMGANTLAHRVSESMSLPA